MIITIDGVTAVGKSSLCQNICLSILEMGIPCKVFYENFDHQMLKKYIEDPITYSKDWTIDITRRKIQVYQEASNYKGLAIIDRGIVGDLAISRMRYLDGELDPELYQWQEEQFKPWSKVKVEWKVFLDCRPEVALSRCRQRGRDGEDLYQLDYFIKQRKAYDYYLNKSDDWTILNTYLTESVHA